MMHPHTLWVLVNKGSLLGANFVLLYILAFVTDDVTAGRYFYYAAICATLTFIGDFGFHGLIIREVNAGRESVATILKNLLPLRYLALIPSLPLIAWEYHTDSSGSSILTILVVSQILTIASQTFMDLLDAGENFRTSATVEFTNKLVLLAATAATLLAKLPLEWIIGSRLLADLLRLLHSAVRVKMLPPAITHADKSRLPVRTLMNAAFHFGVAGFSFNTASQLPSILARHLYGFESVALVAVPQRIIQLFLVIAGSAIESRFPSLCKSDQLIISRDYQRIFLQRETALAGTALIAITGLLVLLILPLPPAATRSAELLILFCAAMPLVLEIVITRGYIASCSKLLSHCAINDTLLLLCTSATSVIIAPWSTEISLGIGYLVGLLVTQRLYRRECSNAVAN